MPKNINKFELSSKNEVKTANTQDAVRLNTKNISLYKGSSFAGISITR